MIQLKRILHPTDFSDSSNHAARHAIALADVFGAELHLVHIISSLGASLPDIAAGIAKHVDDYGELVNQLKSDAMQKMDELTKTDGFPDIAVTCLAEEGNPFLQIIRYAREHEIDLIVIGTHGRTGLSHVLMGSVAERVVRKAPCPVLSVRPEGHEFVMP